MMKFENKDLETMNGGTMFSYASLFGNDFGSVEGVPVDSCLTLGGQ